MRRRKGERFLSKRCSGATRFGLLLAVAALALSACGSASDPVATVVGAAQKTAGLSWVRYQIRFTGSHLFPPTIGVTGARGAFEFQPGSTTRSSACGDTRAHRRTCSSIRRQGACGSPAARPRWLVSSRKELDLSSIPTARRCRSARRSGWRARSAPGPGRDQVGSSNGVVSRHSRRQPRADERVRGLGEARQGPFGSSCARRDGDCGGDRPRTACSRSGRLNIDVWVNGPGYIAKIYGPVPGSRLGTASLTFSSYMEPYAGSFPPASAVAPLALLHPGGRSIWAVAAGP